MSRRKKKEPRIECVAYLSVSGELQGIEKREKKQERYIREYANAHNIDIVGVIRRNGLGQMEVNRHIDSITQLIRKNKVEGIIVANMMAISADIPDAYYKVGKIRAAGGVIVTVDEGRLELGIKESM